MPASSTLVEPAYLSVPPHRETLGPEVADLAEMAGFAPDPEQRLALDAMFAIGADDRAAAFEVGVVACRQNLKTGLFKQAALGWLFLTDQRLVVWSAHEFPTSVEAFRDLSELVEGRDFLTRRLKRIYRGNGDESIELMSGARLIFRARTKGGGRGLSGDKVILDEAFALQPVHMGALLPTLSARPDPQVVYGSSAGLFDSEVLRGVRDRGRSGVGRLAYLEWTAEGAECGQRDCSHVFGLVQGCALDDVDNWRKANPQLGGRIRMDTVHAERQALPWREFARERLGWWDDGSQTAGAFAPGSWERCSTHDRPPDPEALGLALDTDRVWLSLAAASTGYLGAVRRVRYDVQREDLLDELERISRERRIPVALDAKGPAATLRDDLRDRGVTVAPAGLDDYVQACAEVSDAVEAGEIRHGDHDDLNRAVASAGWRPVGDGRRVWSRKGGDVSMLEAVTLARWAAAHNPSVYESRGLVRL